MIHATAATLGAVGFVALALIAAWTQPSNPWAWTASGVCAVTAVWQWRLAGS